MLGVLRPETFVSETLVRGVRLLGLSGCIGEAGKRETGKG